MDTIRNTFAALTAVTEEGHDVAGAIALGVLVAVCLLWWAASEGLLARRRERYLDQTAIARTVGVLREQHDPSYDAEFADELAARLRVVEPLPDERGQADAAVLVSVAILALFFLAVAAMAR